MSEFPPSSTWIDKYKHYICIDILRGQFFACGEWHRLIRDYAVGKQIPLYDFFAIPSFTSVVVYVKNYFAVVRCTYPLKYADCFREAGYSTVQIASAFSDFNDDAENSFYVCIRPTNHNYVDLDGSPTFPHSVYNALFRAGNM